MLEELQLIDFSCRFEPDRGFEGAQRGERSTRDGPVQFEQEDEDIFDLSKFFTAAKRGEKRRAEEPGPSRDYSSSSSSKKNKRRE